MLFEVQKVKVKGQEWTGRNAPEKKVRGKNSIRGGLDLFPKVHRRRVSGSSPPRGTEP